MEILRHDGLTAIVQLEKEEIDFLEQYRNGQDSSILLAFENMCDTEYLRGCQEGIRSVNPPLETMSCDQIAARLRQ